MLLIAAAALLGAFAVVEWRVCNPLLPLRILADRNRAGSFIALALNSFANFGMLIVMTYELQGVLHASPLLTGAALIPWAVANSLGAAVIGPRFMRRVAARYLLVPGLLLQAPADTGATSAMSSTSNQVGASIVTAAPSTIAASATAACVASYPQAASTSALVHGLATATDFSAVILLAGGPWLVCWWTPRRHTLAGDWSQVSKNSMVTE